MTPPSDGGKTNPIKANTNPISSQPKMSVNRVLTQDYEAQPLRSPPENKPNSNPIYEAKKMLLRLTINVRRESFGYHADEIEAVNWTTLFVKQLRLSLSQPFRQLLPAYLLPQAPLQTPSTCLQLPVLVIEAVWKPQVRVGKPLRYQNFIQETAIRQFNVGQQPPVFASRRIALIKVDCDPLSKAKLLRKPAGLRAKVHCAVVLAPGFRRVDSQESYPCVTVSPIRNI